MYNFDQAAWDKLMSGARRQSAAAPAIQPVARQGQPDLDLSLDFTALKRKDPRVKIARSQRGYRIEASSSKVAFSLPGLLMSAGNQMELQFSEDMSYYEPDPELIKKSAVPLWVLRPLGDRTVALERVW